MTIIIPHQTTAEKAIALVDGSANSLFDNATGARVEMTDQKRSWNGPQMDYSLTAKVGFISVPISGTIVVDDVNVTVNCVLPAMVGQFIGEDRIRAGLESRVRGMLTPQA
jgi:hypothetical protein